MQTEPTQQPKPETTPWRIAITLLAERLDDIHQPGWATAMRLARTPGEAEDAAEKVKGYLEFQLRSMNGYECQPGAWGTARAKAAASIAITECGAAAGREERGDEDEGARADARRTGR